MKELTKKNKLAIIFFVVLIIVGLFYLDRSLTGIPNCADKKTVDNVIDIVSNKIMYIYGNIEKEYLNEGRLNISDIVTLSKDSNTGAYFCQATLFFLNKAYGTIQYNNRKIEDKERMFLTTVTQM